MVLGTVHAEEVESKPAVWLQISPPHNTLTLNPGDKYDGEFTVTNIGSEDFIFKVYASPFSVVGENYDHDYLSEHNYNQIYRWITFEQDQYSLSVDESQIVSYHIEVPDDVAAGSQHAVIFAESSGNSTNDSEGGIKAVSRVGMRLSVGVPGETREGSELSDYNVTKLYLSFKAPNVTVSSKIKNTGNTDFEARYHFQVDSFFGGEELHTENKTNLIYPESEYRQEMTWEKTPLLGLFNVTYTVSANGTTEGGTHVVLVMPSWLAIIIIIILTLFIIWIILKLKKRRKLRSKVRF